MYCCATVASFNKGRILAIYSFIACGVLFEYFAVVSIKCLIHSAPNFCESNACIQKFNLSCSLALGSFNLSRNWVKLIPVPPFLGSRSVPTVWNSTWFCVPPYLAMATGSFMRFSKLFNHDSVLSFLSAPTTTIILLYGLLAGRTSSFSIFFIAVPLESQTWMLFAYCGYNFCNVLTLSAGGTGSSGPTTGLTYMNGTPPTCFAIPIVWSINCSCPLWPTNEPYVITAGVVRFPPSVGFLFIACLAAIFCCISGLVTFAIVPLGILITRPSIMSPSWSLPGIGLLIIDLLNACLAADNIAFAFCLSGLSPLCDTAFNNASEFFTIGLTILLTLMPLWLNVLLTILIFGVLSLINASLISSASGLCSPVLYCLTLIGTRVITLPNFLGSYGMFTNL